ncbi:MAG TPA: hypothetical protein VJA94_15425 [Candidatus Angelobacter sp.]
MRLLRLALFFLLVSALVSIPASGQSSSSQQTPNATPSQAPQAQQPSQPAQPPSGDFVRNPFAQQTAGQSSERPELKPLPRFKIKVMQRKLQPEQEPQPLRQGPIDPGIYLPRRAGLDNACGSIVSYNFSPGENPRLESITTCTSVDTVLSRRAGDDGKKPPAPGLVRTKY